MNKPKFIEILKYLGLDPKLSQTLSQEQDIQLLRLFYSSIKPKENYQMVKIEGLDD